MDIEKHSEVLNKEKHLDSLKKNLSFLNILPSEIFWIILNFCKPDDWFMMSKTCWKARNIITGFISSKIRIRNIQQLNIKSLGKIFRGLYSEQIKGLLALRENPESSIFLKSPMGTGKTLLAILHAFESWKEKGIRTIIVCTPKCITSWLEHLKLVGLKLVKSRPEKSDMLVIHSSTKQHRDFFLSNDPDKDISKSPYFIILTTTSYANRNKRHFSNKFLSLTDTFQQIIVDEAHLLDSYILERFFLVFPRRIFLSADKFPGIYTVYNRDSDYYKRCIYDIRVNLECETKNPIEMKCILKPVIISYLHECIAELLNSSEFKGRKVVLFTQYNHRDLASFMRYLRLNVSKYTFVKFNNSNLASLNKFKKLDNCVLVTTLHTATEGTNFEIADSVIYLNFATGISISKARQCFSRVRRRNNPNKVIYNYIFYPVDDRLKLVRSKINIMAALDKSLNIDNKTNSYIERVSKIMEKDGIDLFTLHKPELITIFTHNISGKPLPFTEKDYTLGLMDIIRYMNNGN